MTNPIRQNCQEAMELRTECVLLNGDVDAWRDQQAKVP